MKATFTHSSRFTRWWRDYALDDDDLRNLESVILQDPLAGDVMRDAGGLRKMRFAPRRFGGGKSGAMRICYAWFPEFQVVYLLLVFAKNVQANLDAQQREACRTLIAGLNASLKKQRSKS